MVSTIDKDSKKEGGERVTADESTLEHDQQTDDIAKPFLLSTMWKAMFSITVIGVLILCFFYRIKAVKSLALVYAIVIPFLVLTIRARYRYGRKLEAAGRVIRMPEVEFVKAWHHLGDVLHLTKEQRLGLAILHVFTLVAGFSILAALVWVGYTFGPVTGAMAGFFVFLAVMQVGKLKEGRVANEPWSSLLRKLLLRGIAVVRVLLRDLAAVTLAVIVAGFLIAGVINITRSIVPIDHAGWGRFYNCIWTLLLIMCSPYSVCQRLK
jgi:hypothetical protein